MQPLYLCSGLKYQDPAFHQANKKAHQNSHRQADLMSFKALESY